MKTNSDRLVKISVVGEVASQFFSKSVCNVSATGTPSILPEVAGITHNLRVGDPACDWEADHMEPRVNTENKESDPRNGKELTQRSTCSHVW